MGKVKSVKIDGENIHIFNSAIYVFAASSGYTLDLDLIVSEIVLRKYKKEENLIIEIEIEDGRVFTLFMRLKTWSGGLPQLNLFCEIDNIDDYQDLEVVTENDSVFPNIEEGVTLGDIRKIEMPDEKITLKLELPIDQTEWLSNQKNSQLNTVFKDLIYEYWKRRKNE